MCNTALPTTISWSSGSTPQLAAASAGMVFALAAVAKQPKKASRASARKALAGATPRASSVHINFRSYLADKAKGRTACRVFDRFREDAITAVYGAQEEAIRRGSGKVTTELVLYGILCEDQAGGNRIAQAALAKKGVTREALKRIFATLSFEGGGGGKKGPSLPFGDDTKLLFDNVNADVKGVEVGCEHLLLGLSSPSLAESRGAQVLRDLGVTGEDLRSAVETEMGSTRVSAAAGDADAQKELATVGGGGSGKKLKLSEVGVDLTQMAFDNLLDPVLGREEEMERVIQILLRKKKNNACLVGPPGVGKTAVAEGLAQLIADGKVPPRLRGLQLYSLDLGLLVAGTKYRGEFEDRLQAVIEEATSAEHNMCLFIDEIHQLVGAGVAGPDSSMDAANMLKPALAKGDLRIIGATTLDEYTKYIEKDAALERRFQKVLCEEPTIAQTEHILEGLRNSYEKHHGVIVMPEAITAAVRLSDRYISDRFLPDKAIDLIDEAGSLVQLRSEAYAEDGAAPTAAEEKPRVTADDVMNVLSRWSGVPVERLTSSQADKLMTLEDALESRVIGQADAVNALSRAVRRSRAGLAGSKRPIASFYFAGPTGVGKTELCRVLAEEYYSDPKAMIRLDMSEYSEQHSVSRLLGAPPGYVGYDDPRSGQLTEAVRRQPYSVVVLDEIEKAHSEVFNILLQVLEDGRLTDGKGREVSFCNCMIVMTSNVGSREILGRDDEEDYATLRARVIAQLQRNFRPEFLNRIDELLVFQRLGNEEMKQIVRLTLQNAADRAQDAHSQWAQENGESAGSEVDVHWTAQLEDFILEQGIDVSYGARPLRRAVQRFFEDPLAELLISGSITGSKVTVDLEGEDIIIRFGSDIFRPSLLAGLDGGPAGVEAPQALRNVAAEEAANGSDEEVSASPAVAVS